MIVPVGFPPSHADCNWFGMLLFEFSSGSKSVVTNTSNESTNLPPDAPHSSPIREDIFWSFSFLELLDCFGFSNKEADGMAALSFDRRESSLPKSRVIFQVPGAHGEVDAY